MDWQKRCSHSSVAPPCSQNHCAYRSCFHSSNWLFNESGPHTNKYNNGFKPQLPQNKEYHPSVCRDLLPWMQPRKCLLTSWLVNCVTPRSAVKFMEPVCHINKQSWWRWSESVRIIRFFTLWQSALKPCLYSLHYTPLLTFHPSLRASEIHTVMWTPGKAACLFHFSGFTFLRR